jgi:hypothetical protein
MKLGDLSANCFRADDKTIFVLNILQLCNFSENRGADNSAIPRQVAQNSEH